MSEYDFILKEMRFSYSNLNSFENCKYGWMLTYIKAEERVNNFFSDFGNLIHEIMEKYFKDEIGFFDLTSYYEERFPEVMVSSPPPYPAGMKDNYYQDGLLFLENFDFDKSKYDIIFTENYINTKQGEVNYVVKPDMILQDKETGKYILLDYKTSKLKGNSYDNKKLKEYATQMNLYAHFLYAEKNIEISEIWLWFVRNQEIKKLKVNPLEVAETIIWAEEIIKKITAEEKWEANPSGKYFCDYLCGVRNMCEFRK